MCQFARREVIGRVRERLAERGVVVRPAVADHDVVAVDKADLRIVACQPQHEAFDDRTPDRRGQQAVVEGLGVLPSWIAVASWFRSSSALLRYPRCSPHEVRESESSLRSPSGEPAARCSR
jgi:hypothetical protein